MIIASGVIDMGGIYNLDTIVNELEQRGFGIDDIEGEQIFFQIERKNIRDVKAEVGSLKMIDGISRVHITYYSMEGVD